jgi:hypothetical protein
MKYKCLRKTAQFFVVWLFILILWSNFFSFKKISYGEPDLSLSETKEETQLILYPVKDSFIQHDYPYWDLLHHPSRYNYGGSPYLDTASDAQSNHPRILIRFDLSSIPEDAIITSAHLKLYCFYAGIWKDIACYPLTQSWVEGTMNQQEDPPWQIADGVTWNTYDGINNWISPGGDYASYFLLDKVWIDSSSDTGWKTWNVTPAAQRWVSRDLPNYGLILITTGAGNYYPSRFYSKEYPDSSYWPRLEVSYEVPEPPKPPEEPLIKNLSVSPEVFDPYEKDGQLEIFYDLKEDSLVKVEIYNSKGEKVKALLEDLVEGKEVEKEEEQGAGSHTVKWCGVIDFEKMAILDGDKGVLLAPDGVYTVKMTATSKSTEKVDSARASIMVK